MKFLNSKPVVITVGVIAAGAVLYFFARQTKQAAIDAAGAVGTAINPLDDDNLVNRGVSATGAALTGNESFSLGSWLFDLFNPEFDPNAPIPPADEELQLIFFDELPQRRGAI